MQVKEKIHLILISSISFFIPLILLFFGCSDIKNAVGDRIVSTMILANERYVKKYPEEATLINMLEPFGFWFSLQKTPFEENEVVEQLQKELSNSTGLPNIQFAPVVSLVKIHYPKRVMKISKEDATWIEYVYDEKPQKLGQTDTILRIIERDNDTENNSLTSEFYTLLVWGTENNMESKFIENPIWIYCQFEWDKQEGIWLIKSIGRLLKGEYVKSLIID